MYGIWKIQGGSTLLIGEFRDVADARERAIEQSRLEDAVFAVSRQGFDTPLFFVWRGEPGDALDVFRRSSEPHAGPVLSLEPALPETPSRPRRRKGPDEWKTPTGQTATVTVSTPPDPDEPEETKAKGGQPDVIKAFPTTVTAVDEEQGIVEAIVNVFGIIDDGDDIVHSGAFTKTLAESGARVKVLDAHNNRSALSVIGKPMDIREVSRDALPPAVLLKYPEATGGLYTKTQYLLNTPEGRGVFERIKAGALNEYSIGFDPLDTHMERMTGQGGETKIVRHIQQVRLWEYSPVIWGMNPATASVSVKAAATDEPGEPAEGSQVNKEFTPEGPKRRLGDNLMADLMGACSYLLGIHLRDGMIDAAEYGALLSLCTDQVNALRASMPDDVALRAMPEPEPFFFGATGPDSTKVGRVLSERNFSKVKQASALLADVLSSAGLSDEDEAASADKSRTTESTTDGPQDAPQTPTVPDTAGPSSDAAPAMKQAELLEMLRQRLAEVEG